MSFILPRFVYKTTFDSSSICHTTLYNIKKVCQMVFNNIIITCHLDDVFIQSDLQSLLHSYTVDEATGSNSGSSVLLKDT